MMACSDHSEQYHEESLTKLCRLCSSRLQTVSQKNARKGKIYYVQNYSGAILCNFGIDVSKDEPKVHPTSFCNSCRTAMNNFKRSPKSHANEMKKQDVRDINCRWTNGTATSACFTCQTFSLQTRGGRKTNGLSLPMKNGESGTSHMDNFPHGTIPDSENNAVSQSVVNGNVQTDSQSPQSENEDTGAFKSPSKLIKSLLASKSHGPPTDLEHKLLNHLLDMTSPIH